MALIPNMDNGNRAHHLASERTIRKALADKHAEVLECPAIGHTFVASRRSMTIVRTGILGGDTHDVHGGWVYSNDIAYMRDLHELRGLARTTQALERL